MRVLLPFLFLLVFSAMAWECPRCGFENQGTYCSECHLPEPPPGMVYVHSSQVEIDGQVVYVPGFFIDAQPVSYREFLPWLNGSGLLTAELGSVITGSDVESMEFLAFTPFMGDQNGGITVPAQCFDNPVASITWSGAQSYLASDGRRLPTLGELTAANRAGIIREYDVYQAMSDFSAQLLATMGDMLGNLATQAMFAGYSTARERIMWELTGTSYSGDPGARAADIDVVNVVIYKPGEDPVTSAVHRNNGYFNVIFRGAIEVPEPRGDTE